MPENLGNGALERRVEENLGREWERERMKGRGLCGGREILRKYVRVGFWMGHEPLWKWICCSTGMVLRRTVVRRKHRKGGGWLGLHSALRMRDGKFWRLWTALLRAVRMLVSVMENMASEVPWTEQEGQGCENVRI